LKKSVYLVLLVQLCQILLLEAPAMWNLTFAWKFLVILKTFHVC